MIALTRIHIRNTSSSVQPPSTTFSSAAIPVFVLTTPRPAKRRPQNRILESALEPCFQSSQVLDLTSRRSRSTPSFHRLCDYWLTTAITPSHVVDLSPTLTYNRSLREKWNSVLTGIRAANRFSYFAAAASRSSTQSSGGWIRIHASSLERRRKRREGGR